MIVLVVVVIGIVVGITGGAVIAGRGPTGIGTNGGQSGDIVPYYSSPPTPTLGSDVRSMFTVGGRGFPCCGVGELPCRMGAR
jgi:hypothetical protein